MYLHVRLGGSHCCLSGGKVTSGYLLFEQHIQLLSREILGFWYPEPGHDSVDNGGSHKDESGLGTEVTGVSVVPLGHR
jgi:hypothetical protein